MSSRASQLLAIGLTLLGTAALIVVFAFAIRSSDPRKGKLLSLDTEKLAVGGFVALQSDAMRYFIIKLATDDVHVVAVPTDEGLVPMPETHWWNPIWRCKDFRLGDGDTTVTAESRFQCRDDGQPEPWRARWQWNIAGRHIPDAENTAVDDMYRVRIERSGDEIFLVGLESD